QGRPQARDGRVADAGVAICRHLSLLASSPPRPATAFAAAEKPLQNGLGGGGGGKGPLLASCSSTSGGVGGEVEAVGGGEEVELTIPELSRIGFEVEQSTTRAKTLVEAALAGDASKASLVKMEGMDALDGAGSNGAAGYNEFSSRNLSRAPDSWGMAVHLLPHQAKALSWIRALAGRGLGGVLCDDRGTGKTVTAAATVAMVAACRSVVETERTDIFLAQERKRLSEHFVKGEAEESGAASGASSAGGAGSKSQGAAAKGGGTSAKASPPRQGTLAMRPRPGSLAPPPQLVVVPSWAMARWHMELAQACPRLVIKVWEEWRSQEHHHLSATAVATAAASSSPPSSLQQKLSPQATAAGGSVSVKARLPPKARRSSADVVLCSLERLAEVDGGVSADARLARSVRWSQ
ncbi:unnamed protein product, partial [Ectocarpus sp. 13 AM-2016]